MRPRSTSVFETSIIVAHEHSLSIARLVLRAAEDLAARLKRLETCSQCRTEAPAESVHAQDDGDSLVAYQIPAGWNTTVKHDSNLDLGEGEEPTS